MGQIRSNCSLYDLLLKSHTNPWFTSQIQKSVQAELDEVVGSHSMVTLSHRPNLPYTDATMTEIMRLGPVGPLAAVRCAKEDTKIGKFVIKKGEHRNGLCRWVNRVNSFQERALSQTWSGEEVLYLPDMGAGTWIGESSIDCSLNGWYQRVFIVEELQIKFFHGNGHSQYFSRILGNEILFTHSVCII